MIDAHNGINIGFHIWILFTFLTIFFFTFISRKEKETVTKELNESIKETIPTLLDKVNEKTKDIIDWNKFQTDIEKKRIKYQKPDPKVSKHNKSLLYKSIFISVGTLLLLIGIMVYFTYYKKVDIHIKDILLENFFISIFVGIIEFLFFIGVASKYSPVTTSDMMNQIIDRTKYHINKELK